MNNNLFISMRKLHLNNKDLEDQGHQQWLTKIQKENKKN